jgi:hypothetical protein
LVTICEATNVAVVILNQGEDTTFEEDVAKDALESSPSSAPGGTAATPARTTRTSSSSKACVPPWRLCNAIADRIALDPNNVQATSVARACGIVRFADTWALAEWKRPYAAWNANPSLPKPSQPSFLAPPAQRHHT